DSADARNRLRMQMALAIRAVQHAPVLKEIAADRRQHKGHHERAESQESEKRHSKARSVRNRPESESDSANLCSGRVVFDGQNIACARQYSNVFCPDDLSFS